MSLTQRLDWLVLCILNKNFNRWGVFEKILLFKLDSASFKREKKGETYALLEIWYLIVRLSPMVKTSISKNLLISNTKTDYIPADSLLGYKGTIIPTFPLYFYPIAIFSPEIAVGLIWIEGFQFMDWDFNFNIWLHS